MTKRNYGYDETKAGVCAVIEESGITKQKQANLLRKIADTVDCELAIQRIQKKKINKWYNDLNDYEQRNLVGESIIRGKQYMDQNYYLWSYLRKEDQEKIIKFRKLNPSYPVIKEKA